MSRRSDLEATITERLARREQELARLQPLLDEARESLRVHETELEKARKKLATLLMRERLVLHGIADDEELLQWSAPKLPRVRKGMDQNSDSGQVTETP